MSQTKVQLIAPIGVVTASTLETTGVLTATTFVGDIAGTVTGITSTTDNLNLGIITATSFAGDFTGIGSGLTGTPNVVAGVVTATKFIGNTPGLVSGVADGTNINAGIITATSFVGNITGNAAGLSNATSHANLGIVTATSFSGSGANLDGVSSGPVAQQAVTADGATTTIDLSSGNLIYMTQSANTTVSFANTEGNTDVVYLVRVKDATSTARTITWPSGISWNGGTPPTITNIDDTGEGQIFKLTTRDNGATWYGVEIYSNPGGGTLWSWGQGVYGSLGQNNRTQYSSPVQVGSASGWKGADLWNRGSSTIKTDGTLWAWGANESGMLGLNDTNRRSSPVQVPGTTWSWISLAYGYTSVSTKTDGTLWTCGVNEYGEMGTNDTTRRSSPTQIPGTTWATGVGKITAGKTISAIKTDGTLWSWGLNEYGTMGTNNRTNSSSPTQVPGTTWSKVSTGGEGMHFAAIKTDGTLWMWGNNAGGQCGNNTSGDTTVARYSSPVQIPGTTWSEVRPGNNNTSAIKTDGTLWTWGANGSGQLGNNSTAYASSPIQIPGTTWSKTAQSKYSTFATKTDGTMWSWGANYEGVLGQNNTTNYSSPMQIPGTSWSDLIGDGHNGGPVGAISS